MRFKIPYKVLNTLAKELDDNGEKKHPYIDQLSNRYQDEWIETEIDSKTVNDEDFKLIKDFIFADTEETDERILKIYGFYKNKLKTYENLLSSGSTKKLKSLTEVEISFYSFAKEFPNHRFYKENQYGYLVPWRAMSAVWVKATKDNREHIEISFSAFLRDETITSGFSLFSEHVKGLTIAEILAERNFVSETEEYNEIYEDQISKFEELKKSVGKVYVASGSCTQKNSRWYYNSTYYLKEQESNKVVIDYDGWNLETNNKDKKNHPIGKSNVANDLVDLPIHPIVTIFHLDEHIWLDIHVQGLEKYVFKGKELLKKLILPDEHILLINILMETSKMDIEDIIEGKKGGSFIMSTGSPGTGKTLSAEVFAEAMELALYKVQCSQLGLSIDDVEKNLKNVLRRAGRWGAILLIDEADVYVRARSNDIMQNAIVGVFLRTLEYYTGILFMTSNMETSIDDAIMSRATAHLIYDIPTTEDLRKIWNIQNIQFETELKDDDLDRLVIEIPSIVGRDVKALLKLAKMYSTNRKEQCTVELIKQISKFVPNVAKKIKSQNL